MQNKLWIRNRQIGRIAIALIVFFAVMLLPPVAQALVRCSYCEYVVADDAMFCPKCLRKLQWPIVPARSRSARVVVRTGTDAFIRHPHASVRLYRADRNSGGDVTGHIGSWGGPTTLRYLIRFDIPKAFAMAGVDINTFKVTRVLLKLCIDDAGKHNGLPIRIYPLTRPFQPGSGIVGVREKSIDGCDWYYSAPLLTWHREGGDYADKPDAVAILGEAGASETIIDITELIKFRFDEFAATGIWNDPGMIIMRDPARYRYFGYVTIHSLKAGCLNQSVRSPELFIH
ncbi:MAG: hypothetical protein KKB51_17240 [Candidatus Riflebacteria bacterium]|nr:hypothetical protein [Candidatus Riflebacteria bacterium]